MDKECDVTEVHGKILPISVGWGFTFDGLWRWELLPSGSFVPAPDQQTHLFQLVQTFSWKHLLPCELNSQIAPALGSDWNSVSALTCSLEKQQNKRENKPE